MSGSDENAVASLLQTARDTLMELLPELDPEDRYAVRMAASAMHIAERSLGAGGSRAALASELRTLYPDTRVSDLDFKALSRRFAADIRAGRFDGPELEQRVRRLLEADVRRRLQVSNPTYLEKVARERSH